MCDCRIVNKDMKEHEIDKPIVKTSDIYADAVANLPARFQYPHMLSGYGSQRNSDENPFYRTTSSDYGWHRPNPHTVPYKYFPKGQRFSNELAKCGMYKNFSLNMQ